MVKTIDASPRGPNQPTNATVRGLAWVKERDGDRQHAHHGQTENAVEGGAPGQFGKHRSDDCRAEDEERHARESVVGADRKLGSAVPSRALVSPPRHSS